MYGNNIYKAPSPNVGSCDKTGNWSSKNDEASCKQSFKNAGESAGDYFYCEGGGFMSKYDTNSMCTTGSLVAKNIEQCTKPCVQQGYPTVGGGCSDSFDCDYKNGEICQINDISINGGTEKRGSCIQGENPQQPIIPNIPDSSPVANNAIMELMSNCSQDMSNIDSIKKCLSSINNLSCDDINTLILFIKNYATQQGKYDEIKNRRPPRIF